MPNKENVLNSTKLEKVTGGNEETGQTETIDVEAFANILKSMGENNLSAFLQELCIEKRYIGALNMKTYFVEVLNGQSGFVAKMIATSLNSNKEAIEYLKNKFGDSIIEKGE